MPKFDQYDIDGNLLPDQTPPAPYDPEEEGVYVGNAPTGLSRYDVLIALTYAFFIGIVGSVVTMKILFSTGLASSLLYIGIGYGIGYAISSTTNRNAPMLLALAFTIMAASLLIGHLVYTQDVIDMIRKKEGTSVSLTAALPVVFAHFRYQHWICVFLGFVACWRAAQRPPMHLPVQTP